MAVIELVDNSYKATDDGRITTGPFIDFSRAFDCLDHERLLAKLYHAGIRGLCLKLCRSYLEGREQVVSLNGVVGQAISISKGVPQGCVLGPLFSLIYVNDIMKIGMKGKLWAFADDTTLTYEDKNVENNIDES